MLTLSTTTIGAQPRHRHTPRTAVVAKQDTTKAALEAFSDTTGATKDSAAVASNDSAAVTTIAYDDNNDSANGRFFDFLRFFGGGAAGVIVSIFAMILALGIVAIVFGAIFGLPIWAIILLIKYLFRRHDDRMKVMEKAMENGQPLPESAKSLDKQSDEYLWKRGIRNAAIGLGLIIMFSFWEAMALAGIGGLVLCFGLGQAGTAWYSMRKKDKNDINGDFGDSK